MALDSKVEEKLREFLERSHFASHGAVVTDLDGTAVHEYQGRTVIHRSVERGFKELQELGRPLVLNSLRFPLSVLRTFGSDWYRLTRAPTPTVALNGSMIGFITQRADGEPTFEEIDAFPLTTEELDEVFAGVQRLLDGGIEDVLLFYYARDWRKGEVIWTPVPGRVRATRQKYTSASAVTSVALPELRERMTAEEICMIFLLIDVESSRLMAYQHTRRDNFITHQGVDKLYGTQRIAERLGVDLSHSIGAGDTEMDRFLNGVGLAFLVGPWDLPYRGSLETVRLRDPEELGEALFCLARLQRRAVA